MIPRVCEAGEGLEEDLELEEQLLFSIVRKEREPRLALLRMNQPEKV